jgi:hypothetical protein
MRILLKDFFRELLDAARENRPANIPLEMQPGKGEE